MASEIRPEFFQNRFVWDFTLQVSSGPDIALRFLPEGARYIVELKMGRQR
jgi:hypothetical protein